MLSRVAESMFWMARYIERAENVARFLSVNHGLTVGEDASIHQWAPLIHTTGDQAFFDAQYGHPNRENVLTFLAIDSKYPNSILSCLKAARENGRRIRDHISSVMWEELNKFYLMVKDFSKANNGPDDTYRFLTDVRVHSHLLAGATDATMSHNECWHFGQLGRLLERADKTSRILDVKYYVLLPDASSVGTPIDVVQWSALLQSTDASYMYRRVYGRLAPSKIAEFLILSPEFPRSIRHCINKSEQSLHAISGNPAGSFRTEVEQLMGRLRSELNYMTIEEIISFGLHEFIDDLQLKINAIGNSIHASFFALKPEKKKSVHPIMNPFLVQSQSQENENSDSTTTVQE